MKNYYHILGLTLESKPSLELITSCYKALVKIFHPDVFKGDKKLGEQKIRDINEAFNTLSNTKKRKKYNEELNNYLKSQENNKDSSQNEDSDYQSNEDFNFKQFEKDWELILEVYPHIEEMRLYLTKFSLQLSFQFQAILFSSKSYDKAEELKEILLENFMVIHFGKNKKIRSIAFSLIIKGNIEIANELSRYFFVLGDKDEEKLLNSFLKNTQRQKKNLNTLTIKNIIANKLINLTLLTIVLLKVRRV